MISEEYYGVFINKDGIWSQLPCKKVTREEAAEMLKLFPDPLMFIIWDRESQSHFADKPLLEELGLPEAAWL